MYYKSVNRIVFIGKDSISLDDLLWAETKVRESRKHARAVTGTEIIDFLGITSSHDRKLIASCIRRNVCIIIIIELC